MQNTKRINFDIEQIRNDANYIALRKLYDKEDWNELIHKVKEYFCIRNIQKSISSSESFNT